MKKTHAAILVLLILILLTACAGQESSSIPQDTGPNPSADSDTSESVSTSSDILDSSRTGSADSISGQIIRPDLEEIEQFLNETQILHWIDGASMDSILTEPLKPTSYMKAITSLVLTVKAEQSGETIPKNEEGVPYFPIDDFVCTAKELFGLDCDFEQLAAASDDPAPEGMMCVAWGYDMRGSRLEADPATLTEENGTYTLCINDYYVPFDEYSVTLRKRIIRFKCNTDERFAPIQLISVEATGESAELVWDETLRALLGRDNGELRQMRDGPCCAEITQRGAPSIAYLDPYLSVQFAPEADNAEVWREGFSAGACAENPFESDLTIIQIDLFDELDPQTPSVQQTASLRQMFTGELPLTYDILCDIFRGSRTFSRIKDDDPDMALLPSGLPVHSDELKQDTAFDEIVKDGVYQAVFDVEDIRLTVDFIQFEGTYIAFHIAMTKA